MASQGQRGGVVAGLLPFPRDAAERLDWHVGAELVAADDRHRHAALSNPETRCRLDVFEGSDATALVRFRTAVGREKYYGVPRTVLRDAVADLPGAWRVTDGEY